MPLRAAPAAPALALAAMALAGCLAPAGTVDPAALPAAPVPALGTVTHLAGGALAEAPAGMALRALWRELAHDAVEPTLGVLADGTLLVAAAVVDENLPTRQRPRTDVLRSRDHGLTWEDVSPRLPTGHNAPPETSDPYLLVDAATGRVYNFDMFPGLVCGWLSWSDDAGDTWDGNPLACGNPPPWDHQTLVAAKPRVLPTAGYENVLVQCVNRVTDASCARSLDGGRTWAAGAPAFLGVQAPSGLPGPGPALLQDFCGGLHGHLVSAPDGTLYLPKDHCGRPWVAISRDDATTWEDVRVADVPTTGGPDPAMAVDEAGNVYYAFVEETGRLMLSVSRDMGASWGEPLDVGAPAVTASHLPALAAGAEGKLAIAYVGTENLPEGYANEEFRTQDTREDGAIHGATWNGYLAVLAGALAPVPLVQTTRVNDPADPLVRGYCGPGRCPGMYDFIDVVVDAEGRPFAAFVDACIGECAGPEGTWEHSQGAAQGRLGAVATLAAGPALRGAGALPPLRS